MSQENVETVRLMYEAAPELERVLDDRGDLSGHPWLSLWHPECVLEEMADVPDATAYRGRDGVADYFERAFHDVWDEWRFAPIAIIGRGDAVFAEVDNRGRSKSGVEVTLHLFQVFHFREGLIVHATAYLDRQQALTAAALAE
jgi:ketosteroid isomerase-like protein